MLPTMLSLHHKITGRFHGITGAIRWNKIKFYGDTTDEQTLSQDKPGVIILHDAASYPSIQGYDKNTYKLGYWFSFYDNENRLIDYYLHRDGRMGSINIDVFTLQRGS